jgi:hypothetical protein
MPGSDEIRVSFERRDEAGASNRVGRFFQTCLEYEWVNAGREIRWRLH